MTVQLDRSNVPAKMVSAPFDYAFPLLLSAMANVNVLMVQTRMNVSVCA